DAPVKSAVWGYPELTMKHFDFGSHFIPVQIKVGSYYFPLFFFTPIPSHSGQDSHDVQTTSTIYFTEHPIKNRANLIPTDQFPHIYSGVFHNSIACQECKPHISI